MKILKGLFLHPILGCLLIPSLVPISPESLAVDASRTIESNHPPFLSETLETLTNTTLFPDFVCDIDFDPNQAGESLNSADEGQIAAPLESVVNEIPSESYPPNGFHDEITSSNPHAPLSWKYYRFDIPNGILAWRLYVDQVVSGYPSIFIGRGVLPDGKNTPRINDRGEPREDGGFYSQLKQGDQMRAYTSWFSPPNEILSRDIMLAGGAPLITLPDTDVPYFIGIFNGSNDPAVYEFHSSIIDDDLTPFSSEIQGVDSLDFEGGIASIQDLNADTALFFKTVIPEGKRTWRLELNPSQGDAKMYVRRDFIPDYTATYVSSGFGGVKMDREGPEMYYELPYKIGFASNEEFLNPGEYYIAVVPDPGIPFSGELLSLGEIPITSIPSTETTQEIPFSLAGAEIQLFQLEEMVGDHSIASELKDLSGDIDLAVRADHLIPSPSNAQLYGFTGNNTSTRSNIGIVGLNILQPGFRTILIQSRQLSSFAPNLTGVLKITRTAVETIDLNEGVIQVEDQAPFSWRIFKISVPQDGRLGPNEEPILGWFPEVIESVQSSFPETTMLIRKGIPPEGTHEFFFDFPRVQGFDGGRPSKSSIWPEEAIWPSRMILNSRHGLLAAWNKPLDGGTYYAGVYNPSRENSVSYTFRSRTLGQPGSSSSIQVKELEFENGEENIVNQLAGEISFYKVKTPEENEEARSWHAFVKPEGTGELSMAIRSDFIPDFNAKDHPSDILTDIGGGAFLEKQGKELFQIFPEEGEMFLDGAKDYYIAVTSLGNEVINNVKSGQVNFTIHSEGEIPIQEIDVSTGSAEIDFNLEVEEVNLYSLYIPENSLSIEISLEDLAGGYVSFAIRKGALVPKGLRFSNYYGLFGGTEESAVHSDSLITINNPSPGIYTLILKSPLERGTSSKPDVNGKLKFKLFSEIELAFIGGESKVVEQLPNTWKNYTFIVPEDDSSTRGTGIPAPYLGVDLRIELDIETSERNAEPGLYIRRLQPPELSGINEQSRNHPWIDANQLFASENDWTQKPMLYDFGPSTSHMRELLPMGAPLAPGKYVVGVYNRSSSQNCSYKLTSSGIGELGSGADFEVQNLPFSSGRSQVTLAPREASYYRVIIPEDTYRTWRVRVNKIDGDAGLAVKKDHIPDFRVSMDGDTEDPNSGYRLYHVTGDEVFTLLPPNGQEFLTGGEYFLALFGMGKEAAQTVGSTGSGDSLIELVTEGELEIVNLGEISRVGDSIVKTLNVSDPDF